MDDTKDENEVGDRDRRRRRERGHRKRTKKREGIAEELPPIDDENDDVSEEENKEGSEGGRRSSAGESDSKNPDEPAAAATKRSDESVAENDESSASETEPLIEEKSKEVHEFKQKHLYDLSRPAIFRHTHEGHRILVKRQTKEILNIRGGVEEDEEMKRDGLFVPKKPLISKWNMNLHGQRNIRDGTNVLHYPVDPINDRGRITFEIDDTKDAISSLLHFHKSTQGSPLEESRSSSGATSSKRVQLVLKYRRRLCLFPVARIVNLLLGNQ
eukprot:g1204.t1